MRCRTEDLGRIAVLLDQVLDHEVFNLVTGAAKHFSERFNEMNSKEQEDTLTSFAYGYQEVESKLHEIREIARGEDTLNETPNV